MSVYFIAAGLAKPGIIRVCVSIGLRPIKIFRQSGTTDDQIQNQYSRQKGEFADIVHGYFPFCALSKL
jgi:hypothetical protein